MAFKINSSPLDICVLAVLNRGDTYGYMLTQTIKTVIDVSESSLYPVLRRLQRDECLNVYEVPYGGRLRRYYTITDMGRETLAELISGWNDFKGKIDKIINENGGNMNEQE